MSKVLTLDTIKKKGAPQTIDKDIDGLGTLRLREPTGTEVLGLADDDEMRTAWRTLALVALNDDDSQMFENAEEVEALFGEVSSGTMSKLITAATEVVAGEETVEEAGK